MKPIPIDGDVAPMGCTAGRDGLPARKAQLRRLRDLGPAVEPTEHGLLLRFADRPDVAAEVLDFTVAEKGCCSFWHFSVDAVGDRLTLRWDAPPAARELLHGLAGFFAGDDTHDGLEGLDALL